tara:strand:- start:557 stop:1027 length:471 start_codon:yes stop_codon:yes gene_type:complete
MVLKKDMQARIEELEEELLADKDRIERFESFRDEYEKRNTELEGKILDLEQIISDDELEKLNNGELFRVCDPELIHLHKVRDIGIDIFLEDDTDKPKKLLTRIPINPEFEVQENMTWQERMERVGPLVDALCKALENYGDYHVRVQASISKMKFSW